MSIEPRIWRGKARIRAAKMHNATYDLINLLDKLALIPLDFDDDWDELFRCYVDRRLGEE